MDRLIEWQGQYSVVAVVIVAALAGVLVHRIVRNLPWMALIVVIWGGLWIVAMPAGVDNATLVAGQKGLHARLDCARSLVGDLDYWNGHRSTAAANCSPR